jgi:hypothetical protein
MGFDSTIVVIPVADKDIVSDVNGKHERHSFKVILDELKDKHREYDFVPEQIAYYNSAIHVTFKAVRIN